MDLYHVREPIYRASIYLDDGDDPIAGAGVTVQSLDLQDVKRLGLLELEKQELEEPAKGEGFWYVSLEVGHYERDEGEQTGVDSIDFDWIPDFELWPEGEEQLLRSPAPIQTMTGGPE